MAVAKSTAETAIEKAVAKRGWLSVANIVMVLVWWATRNAAPRLVLAIRRRRRGWPG